MRNRLKKLIDEKQVYGIDHEQKRNDELLLFDNEELADHLIANGVIVMPFNVGETVYVITNCENILMYHDNDYETGTGAIECPFENSCDFEECADSNLRIFETMVVTIHCEEGIGWTFWCEHIHKDFAFSEIGNTVFLTREDAEKALAEVKE